MASRIFNRTLQVLLDLAILAAAYVLAYVVRFEGSVPLPMARTLVWTLPYVVALHYACIFAFGVHRLAWRYVGLSDARRIAIALTTSTALFILVRVGVEQAAHLNAALSRAIVPFGAILTSSTFSFLGVTGVRVLRRMMAERSEAVSRVVERASVPTMLIGAGRAGVLVAKECVSRPDVAIRPVGFLDDDPVKIGTVIQGIPVLGTTAQLAQLCEKHGAEQALISIASASGKAIRRIKELCDHAQVPVKIIPGLFEIVGGKVNLSRIRKVAIEDLLGRDPITLDEAAILEFVRGRVVLVTGAGGSIGSELCRQLCLFAPAAIVLVDHAENSLFHIERELRGKHPDVALHVLVADIRDEARMHAIFGSHRPQVVFHAAAHKHVPMMEANPGEAVKNNVLGTKCVAEVSDAHGVAEFVMISTDKAVNPTSVMGVSKRAAEVFVQALSQRSKTRFVAVRFGNVLGSAGSVVPLFQEQIAAGGPVTITDPEMKRYFMTIPEACQLVLQAGAMGQGGEIFVLDMGEPVKIVDLARDLIKLSGLREGDDIEVRFTGLRPGEKLFEELALEEEGAERTRHPKVFIGRIKPHSWDAVQRFIAELDAEAANGAAGDRIRTIFKRFIPEYTPETERKRPSVASAAQSAAPRRTATEERESKPLVATEIPG